MTKNTETPEPTTTATMILSLPFPADMALVKVAQREGSKPAAIVARVRSFVSPFTLTRGDETEVTKAKGNSGHNVPLNAAQAAEFERIVSILRDPKHAERAAIVEAIKSANGISLPVNVQGRQPAKGESVADAFADLLTD